MFIRPKQSAATTSIRLISFLAIMFLTSACTRSFSAHAPAETLAPVAKEVGVASYYSNSFQGHSTASGEPYNKNLLTVAHRYLPFGTIVQVRNLYNGRTVNATVNDRGPYARGRIIDLSQAAAQQIGMLAQGVAKVEVVTLRP